MRHFIAKIAIALTLVIGSAPIAGCGLFRNPTKVESGRHYRSGDGRYDPYFTAVHQEQAAASKWPSESKNARKPLTKALKISTSASNDTIVAATRSREGDASLDHAVQQTAWNTYELARRLKTAAARLEELHKRGEALKDQASDERRNLGASKADEKRLAKKDEVKRELGAAVDVTAAMASDARKLADEAEELATKLRAAWADSGRSFGRRPREPKSAKGADKKKGNETASKKGSPKKSPSGPQKRADDKATKKKPAQASTASPRPPEPKPTQTPPPEPKPTPAQPPEEIFNP